MSFIIDPYRYAAAGGGGITWTDETSGALVYRTSDTALSANDAVPWNAEIYDTASWHDNSTNPERLSVPSGVTLARVIGNSRSATGGYWYLQKTGSAFDGQGYERSDTAGNEGTNIASAIVAVTPTTDYFTIHTVGALTLTATGGIIVDDGQSWFAVEAISTDRPYALVKMSGDQAIGVTGTWVTVTFATEIADTDGFYDFATSSSKLVVPAGVSLVRLSANLRYDGGTGEAAIQLLKNGSIFYGSFRQDETGATAKYISATSAILAVAPGDEFELQVLVATTGNVIAGNATWFQIEAIHPNTKYAVATAASVSTSAAFNNVALPTEAADTHGFHDTVTDNSRLTIPTGQGITQARLSFNLHVSTANQLIGRVTMNGDTSIMVPGLPCDEGDTGGEDAVGGFGAWIDVVDGDYFDLQAFSGTGTDVGVAGQNWFCIECR